jgi:hypothetical protein
MEFNIINFCETDIKKKYNNNLDFKSQFPEQQLCFINIPEKQKNNKLITTDIKREEDTILGYNANKIYHESL